MRKIAAGALRLAGLAVGLAALGASGTVQAQETWHPSVYGAQDRLGALNNLTPEGVLNALRLVREGKVYSLAMTTGASSPAFGDRRYSVQISPGPGAKVDPVGSNQMTGHDEKVTTSMGIGTQMDGLGHVGIAHRYYNGLTSETVNTPSGFRELDMSAIPPIVTRGVVLDMVSLYGRPLEAGEAYNVKEIKAALAAAKVTLGKGDVVLFHTGWMRKLPDDKAAYSSTEPGLGKEGAAWLASQGVVAVGSDTLALEVLPSESATESFPVHQILLARHGVHILEGINTAPLVKDGVREFLFVLGAPRFEGTVQVVVNPVAIR